MTIQRVSTEHLHKAFTYDCLPPCCCVWRLTPAACTAVHTHGTTGHAAPSGNWQSTYQPTACQPHAKLHTLNPLKQPVSPEHAFFTIAGGSLTASSLPPHPLQGLTPAHAKGPAAAKPGAAWPADNGAAEAPGGGDAAPAAAPAPAAAAPGKPPSRKESDAGAAAGASAAAAAGGPPSKAGSNASTAAAAASAATGGAGVGAGPARDSPLVVSRTGRAVGCSVVA